MREQAGWGEWVDGRSFLASGVAKKLGASVQLSRMVHATVSQSTKRGDLVTTEGKASKNTMMCKMIKRR